MWVDGQAALSWLTGTQFATWVKHGESQEGFILTIKFDDVKGGC